MKHHKDEYGRHSSEVAIGCRKLQEGVDRLSREASELRLHQKRLVERIDEVAHASGTGVEIPAKADLEALRRELHTQVETASSAATAAQLETERAVTRLDEIDADWQAGRKELTVEMEAVKDHLSVRVKDEVRKATGTTVQHAERGRQQLTEQAQSIVQLREQLESVMQARVRDAETLKKRLESLSSRVDSVDDVCHGLQSRPHMTVAANGDGVAQRLESLQRKVTSNQETLQEEVAAIQARLEKLATQVATESRTLPRPEPKSDLISPRPGQLAEAVKTEQTARLAVSRKVDAVAQQQQSLADEVAALRSASNRDLDAAVHECRKLESALNDERGDRRVEQTKLTNLVDGVSDKVTLLAREVQLLQRRPASTRREMPSPAGDTDASTIDALNRTPVQS